MTIQETVNFTLKQIETITSVAVNSIKSNIFKVSVGNFPKTQDVKGTVIVGNLKGEMRDLSKKIDAVEKAIKSTTYPDSITIKNIKDTPVAKEVVIPPFPESITVKNPQKTVEVSNLEKVTSWLEKLGKKIDKIELSPKIEVKSPVVNVEAQKPPIINIPDAEKLISDDPEKSIPVRLSDGKKFYNAIEGLVVQSLKKANFSDILGHKKEALVDSDRHLQVDVLTSSLPTGASTSAKQDNIISELQTLNSLVPSTYDNIVVNYTDSTKQNISNIVYKLGDTIVSTITKVSGSTSNSWTKS